MPLRAFIDGEEVIAPALSEGEWEALRQSVQERSASVILPCCGSEGYLRRSGLGTQHFAHKKGAHCDAPGETIYHLKAKADIVLACTRAGYPALTEVAGEDWRADVLAVKGATRIAFEVQWSFLRLDAAVYRQERYARDGVRGCWFFRNPPPQITRGNMLKARDDLPLFHLWANADNSFSVSLNERLYGLGEFVEALLKRQIHFCESATARAEQTLTITPFAIPCPTCGRSTHVYRVDPTLIALCGKAFRTHALEFRREVIAAARELAQKHRHFQFGVLQERVSAEGKKELLFGCAHCGAAITPEQIEMALYGARHLLDGDRYPVTMTFQKPITTRVAHWCFPDDGEFCCEK